ncbi:hypothetical protein QJQ45_006906 [Haematococcus lacustris]|nr:hypothetical protein QJQ45_006906 [Haematococcus lacustris]
MAANLAASPWASWFMDNSDGHPPEAGVVHLPHEPGLASDTQPSHTADAALNQAAWWAEAAQAPGGRQQDHQQQPQPQLPMWLDIPASAMQQQQQPGRPHEPRRQAEPQADQLAQADQQGAGLGGQHQALAWEVPVSELRRPSTASQPPSREGRGAGKGARQPGEPRAYAGVRPEVAQLARGWVGDFGKLQPQPQYVTQSSCPEPRNIPSPMLGLVGRRQPQPDDDPEAAALRAEPESVALRLTGAVAQPQVYALRSRLQQLAKQGGGLEHLAPTVAEMRANLLALNTATRGAGSLEPLTDALAASRSVDGMRSAPQGLSRANFAMPPGMAGDERAIALARSLIAAAAERAASAGEVQAGPSTREQPALARSDGQQASGFPATSGAPMSPAGAAAPNDVSNVLGARAGSPTVAHLPSHGMGASCHSTYEGIDYDYIESEYSTASAGSSGHDVAANDRRIAWGECGEEHARQNSAWQLEAAEQLQRLLRHQLQLAREEDERLQQQEQALALPEPSPTPSDPPAVLAEELLAPQHGAHQSNSPQPSHMLPGITGASTKQAVRLSILGQAPELVQGRLDHQDHQDHEKQFVPELPEAGRFAAPTRAAGPSGDHYNSLLRRAQPDPAGTVVQTSGLGHEAPTRATSRSSWMSVEPASRGQLASPPSSFCSSSSQGSSVGGAAGVTQHGNIDSHTPAEQAAVPPQPPTPPIPPPPSTALVPAKDNVPGTSASGLTITPGAPTREVGPPACTPALPPLAAVTAPPNPHMAPAAPASSTASLLHNRLNHPALRTSASSFTSFGSGSSLGDEELLQQSILQLTNMLSDSDSDLDLSAWAAWAPTSHALTAALHRASQGAVPPPPATLPPSDPASTPTSHHTSVTSATLALNAATKSAGGEGWAGDQDRGKLGEEGGQRLGRLGQAESQAGSSAASFSAAQSPPSQITTTTITTVSRILATLPHNDWGTPAAQVAGSQGHSFLSASLGATISLGTDEISGRKPTIQTQMPQMGATVHEARQQVLPGTSLANAGDAAPARRPRVHATLHDAVDPAHVSAGLVGAVTLRGLGTSFLAAAGQVNAVSPRSGLHSSTELSLSDQTRASSSAIWQQRAGGAAGLGSSSLSSLSLSSGLSGVPGGGGVQWGQPGSQQPLQQHPSTSWTLHGLGAAIAGQAASHDLPFHHQSMADAVVGVSLDNKPANHRITHAAALAKAKTPAADLVRPATPAADLAENKLLTTEAQLQQACEEILEAALLDLEEKHKHLQAEHRQQRLENESLEAVVKCSGAVTTVWRAM